MNERIKELAEQAGFSLWTNEAWKPEGANVDWSCNYDRELEKFAELIIQECSDIASINQHQYDSVGTYVLKHFGLKE